MGEQVGAPATLRITDLTADAYWPPKLTGVVAVQALAAVAVYTVLAGFAAHPDLHPDGAKALDAVDDPGPLPPADRSQAQAVRPDESDVPAAAEPGMPASWPDATISSAPGGLSDPKDSPEQR